MYFNFKYSSRCCVNDIHFEFHYTVVHKTTDRPRFNTITLAMLMIGEFRNASLVNAFLSMSRLLRTERYALYNCMQKSWCYKYEQKRCNGEISA